jgi:cyanophycin synthetase
MVSEKITDVIRINARRTDVFDVFNFKYYIGPNPYLDTGALVFNFSLTGYRKPLAIEDYISIISDRYPHLGDQKYESFAHLFARVVSEIGKLDIDLHLNRWSIKPYTNYMRISVQSLQLQEQ